MNLYIEPKHLQIVHKIFEEYDYSFFVFGSRVSGKNKKFSDLDIFFLENIPNKQLLNLEEAFEDSDLPFKVDIVDFKKCEPSFQAIMMQNYLCLKSSSKLNTIEQNHLGHFAYLPKNLDFDVHEMNGITIINCGLQTSMFNIAYGAPKGATFDIDQIKQSYKGQPFAWWIPPSEHNPNTTKALIESGFIIATVEHAMIYDFCHSDNFKQKTDLMIRLVTKTCFLQDYVGVLQPYDPCVSTFYGRMNDKLLQADEKLFIGYTGSKPVSIGILFIAGSSSGIFSLVTNTDSRGLGYGTDMMLFLMKFAKDHGCKSVTLSASSNSGYRIYERLGFVKLGEFECFEFKSNSFDI